MKEKRLAPAESFSLGNGARGVLIARTGSLIASGGNAVCCCAGAGCWPCPIASANMQSSRQTDERNDLSISFPIGFLGSIGFLGRWIRETAHPALLQVVAAFSNTLFSSSIA